MKHSWDIFCSVVDNYGDIGVCWRLARQLTSDHGQSVRLFVDDLASFQRLWPAIDCRLAKQSVERVEVHHWTSAFPEVEPAEIVVEGFGVRLPQDFLNAMASRRPAPVWINLEHISAEPWVDEYHGLPSPHPTLPLTKHFFFPGFTAKTGGVLVERNLHKARLAFQSDPHARNTFLSELGLDPADRNGLCVSLFCYDNAPLGELTAAWSTGAIPLVCMVPDGSALTALRAIYPELAAGRRVVSGQLTLVPIPFLDVDRYDRLLWACDLNFVRGEDSFVRAQLAGRPLVWQAYVQMEKAHLAKQAAFLDRYLAGVEPETASAWRLLHDAWATQGSDVGRYWEGVIADRSVLVSHAEAWAAKLNTDADMATKLADFCQDRLE